MDYFFQVGIIIFSRKVILIDKLREIQEKNPVRLYTSITGWCHGGHHRQNSPVIWYG